MKASLQLEHLAHDASIGAPKDWQRFKLRALLCLGLMAAAANAVCVAHKRGDAWIYTFTLLTTLLAAISQWIVRPSRSFDIVKVRWALWVAFLSLIVAGYGLAALRNAGIFDSDLLIKNICYSAAYALAYVVSISPPRSSVWRRLWLVDVAIAAVVGSMFLLVYRHTNRDPGLRDFLFSLTLKAIFAVGGLLSFRAASGPDARRLARTTAVYFTVSFVVALICDAGWISRSTLCAMVGDIALPLDALTVLAIPVLFRPAHTVRQQGRPLPAAITVLLTAAILLICLPLLHWNFIPGIALLVIATTLFAVKVALLQSDFDHERASLLHGHQKLRELAYSDPLTGIANRRRFLEALDQALLSAHRGFGSVSLVLFDLDHLKKINDTQGHPAGDRCIVAFVSAVRDSLHPDDAHFARLGGDEFGLLLDRIDRPAVEAAIHKVRQSLQTSSFCFSAGVATAASSGPDSVETWLKQADSDLYEKKRERRQVA